MSPRTSSETGRAAAAEPPLGRGWRLADRALVALILLPLVALFAAYAVGSLHWRIEHDVPLAVYSAFSYAENGTRPYAQLFEISFPGTIIVHVAMAKLFGYGEFGCLLANQLSFLLLAVLTILWMRPFGFCVTLGGIVLFGVAFYMHGPTMLLQRDYLLLLPVVAATLLQLGESSKRRRIVVGVLVGMAAAIKPHAVVALVPLLVAELARCRANDPAGGGRFRRFVAVVAPYLLGFLVPCAAVLVWLWIADGIAAWQEMSSQYLPLYLQMNKYHEVLGGMERVAYFVRSIREFGGHWPWFLAAALGTSAALLAVDAGSAPARRIRMLLAQAVAFALYPCFAGQFWDYHYIPFLYFVCLLAALCLGTVRSWGSPLHALLPRLALALSLFLHPDLVSATKLLRAPPSVKGGQVDAMADFLRERLQPADTVQPLDWTGGAVHAMLLVRARLATRFLYDYHFYHHVQAPFIQELRRRFLAEFAQARPRFVLEYFGENKPWASGEGTTRSFLELQAVLASDYVVASRGAEYRIHERR